MCVAGHVGRTQTAEQIQDETAAPALSGDLQQLGAEPREVPLGVC